MTIFVGQRRRSQSGVASARAVVAAAAALEQTQKTHPQGLPYMAASTSYRPRRLLEPTTDAPSESDVLSLRGGRPATQFRPTHMKVGVVERAVGSAYVEAGGTKIIAAVYGPRQTEKAKYSEKGRLKCDLRYTSVTSPDPERHARSSEEKEPSQQMHRALEVSVRLDKYPKSVIDVFVMVLDSDGGVLPLAITCGSLALAHAGIEMFDLVAACSATTIAQSVYLDPTAAEETRAAVHAVRSAEAKAKAGGSIGGSATLATMPSLGRVTQLAQAGEMPLDVLTATISQLEEGCRQLLRKQRAVLCAEAGA